MKKHLMRAMTASLMLLAAACAETPQNRIEQNPGVFASLPQDHQMLIRAGQVGIGFTEAEVKLAVGNPDRITNREDEKGKSVEWRYVEYETTGGAVLYTGFYHSYWGPVFPFYTDYPDRRERDVMRVTFRDGKVISVERSVK